MNKIEKKIDEIVTSNAIKESKNDFKSALIRIVVMY